MKIFQLCIQKLHYEDFLFSLKRHIENGKQGKSVFTPNPEICLKTLTDVEFLGILQKSDFLTSDGIGLYIAYQVRDFLGASPSFFKRCLCFFLLPYCVFRVLGFKKKLYQKYGERICGSDLTSSLVTYAQSEKIRIAIIDPYYPNDKEKCESQKSFREKVQAKFPGLLFDFYVFGSHNSDEVFDAIARSDAKILFSTLGMKRQEISVLEGLSKCPNLRIGLGIGSSFDYYTGFQKRAPKLWRQLGFEWLYRIFTSPNKLARLVRIYQALIVFPIKVVFYNERTG